VEPKSSEGRPTVADGPGAVLVRYARAVDTRDWEELERCFSDRAKVVGTLREDDIGPYLEFLKASLGPFSSTMHVMANQLVELEGDGERASVETYAVAYHVAGDSGGRAPTLTMGVVYADEMVREGDAWKIVHRRVTPKWVEGALPG
jgi:3-phenylpropionate/cinnamic acid dioxygenase small subunit